MLSQDKDALICDLAETYNIYDYRSLPAELVATLAVGLRDTSRIKMKISGRRFIPESMLLSMLIDNFNKFMKGMGMIEGEPFSLTKFLMGEESASDISGGFNSPEEFMKERRKIIGDE